MNTATKTAPHEHLKLNSAPEHAGHDHAHDDEHVHGPHCNHGHDHGHHHGPGVTLRREGPKIGRNDPCPCGSGKKYKKCCQAA